MYELKVYNDKKECYFKADLSLEGTLEQVIETFASIVNEQNSRARFGSRWVNLNNSAYYEIVPK